MKGFNYSSYFTGNTRFLQKISFYKTLTNNNILYNDSKEYYTYLYKKASVKKQKDTKYSFFTNYTLTDSLLSDSTLSHTYNELKVTSIKTFLCIVHSNFLKKDNNINYKKLFFLGNESSNIQYLHKNV